VLCIIFGYSHREGRSPSADLLCTVDAVLSISYSRAADSPELLEYSLRLLVAVRDGIVSSAPAQVMHIVVALRNSLPLWIEDRIEVMSINDFNSVVRLLFSSHFRGL
jgi:hypothetical protein